ncbi:hypothetical protein N8546_00905 [bacterium]|nr:hypothetical protein [bacterium]
MNKTQLVRILAIGAMALGQADLARAADANPPERMTYQGFLVDGNGAALGNSVPANYDVVFRIYNAKSGGTPIWSEQQTVTVDKGYFSVLLGEGSQVNSEDYGSLSAAFDGADASDRFIGLTVSGLGGGDVEIAPRLRLVTSPYSFTASNARRLTDGSGNANFFKEGATLKLGAGSTPTLTLPEAGGASLAGTLTVGLPSWGTGLQIDNGSTTTTIGALNASYFHFTTSTVTLSVWPAASLPAQLHGALVALTGRWVELTLRALASVPALSRLSVVATPGTSPSRIPTYARCINLSRSVCPVSARPIFPPDRSPVSRVELTEAFAVNVSLPPPLNESTSPAYIFREVFSTATLVAVLPAVQELAASPPGRSAPVKSPVSVVAPVAASAVSVRMPPPGKPMLSPVL